MQESGIAQETTIACPRCGYDQRGPVSTWVEQCPLEGRCSECGLVFRWAEVFGPEKFEPSWNIEYVRRWWRLPWAATLTYVRSLWPRRFWTRLKMSHRVRPLRLALYMFASVLPVILILYVPVQAATAIRVRMYIAKTIVNAPLQQNSGWLQMYQRQLANKERVLANLKANNARQSEIDDAEWERNQLLAMIAQLQPPPPSTVIINQPYWRAIVERVCFPGSTTSWGSIQMPDGSIVTYPPPPQLQSYAGSWRWGQTVNPSQQLFQTIGCAVLYMMLLPVTFVLLPASRRIAKVKWAHVWRVAAYSVTMIVVAVTAVGATVLFVDGAFGWSGAIVAVEYVGVATWFFAAWWWAVAIRHYLRMPHAGAIAGLMSLMLALLMSPCLLSILPRWISTMIVG